jgi:hypothetical protein
MTRNTQDRLSVVVPISKTAMQVRSSTFQLDQRSRSATGIFDTSIPAGSESVRDPSLVSCRSLSMMASFSLCGFCGSCSCIARATTAIGSATAEERPFENECRNCPHSRRRGVKSDEERDRSVLRRGCFMGLWK